MDDFEANLVTTTLLANMAGAINNSIPDILLGKLGSAAQVGLLSRANSTVQIFLLVAGSTVNYGAISYLAQIFHRGESLVPMVSGPPPPPAVMISPPVKPRGPRQKNPV